MESADRMDSEKKTGDFQALMRMEFPVFLFVKDENENIFTNLCRYEEIRI